MWAIIKKEFRTYFLSPIGYVFIGSFLLMASFFFYVDVYSTGNIQYSYLFYFTTQVLTFSVGILTMGMFAGERKNGTETLLLTSSRSITSITLGKFFAALAVIAITEVFSLIYYAILCYFAGGITSIPETIATLIGFLLVAMAYIAFGMFISSLTENQIIAVAATIGLLLASWYIPNLSSSLEIISPIAEFQKYPGGIIPIKETVALLSLTIMFILFTIIVMQRRKNLK